MRDELHDQIRSAIGDMIAESPEPPAYQRIMAAHSPVHRFAGPAWAAIAFLVVVVALGAVVLLRASGTPAPFITPNGSTTSTPPTVTTEPAVTTSTTPTMTTSTSTPDAGGSGLVTEPALTLAVEPAVGRPGDPLTICGEALGRTEIRVVLSDPATGDSWPDEIDEFVTPDDSGHWCWSGLIPTEMQSNDPRTMGKRHPVTPGVYQVRVDSLGDVLGYGILEVAPPEATDGEPSQSPEDAARDGVVPELAALPIHERVHIWKQVATPEGLWVSSSMDSAGSLIIGSCTPSQPGCLYGRDYVVNGEYGEVLLLDAAGQKILRAYPLPGFPLFGFGGLVATDDAIYCGRQGDGALPDSMLCRIDRRTGDWIVRLFPAPFDSAYVPPNPEMYIPDNWTINDPVDQPLFLDLMMTEDGLVTVGYDNQAVRVDPDTLELLDLP